LVDGSDRTYTGGLADFWNPTNGSWWMLQIRPSNEHGFARHTESHF
jgi:hypothetical protein